MEAMPLTTSSSCAISVSSLRSTCLVQGDRFAPTTRLCHQGWLDEVLARSEILSAVDLDQVWLSRLIRNSLDMSFRVCLAWWVVGLSALDDVRVLEGWERLIVFRFKLVPGVTSVKKMHGVPRRAI